MRNPLTALRQILEAAGIAKKIQPYTRFHCATPYLQSLERTGAKLEPASGPDAQPPYRHPASPSDLPA